MKKTLLIIVTALMAAGCTFEGGQDGRDGQDGKDGSVNMYVNTYTIYDRDWIFDPGVGSDGLNRHYFYVLDKEIDKNLNNYLTSYSYNNGVVLLYRVFDTHQVLLNHSQPQEGYVNSEIENWSEYLTYDFSANPAQIFINYFDSRFLSDNEYEPVTMTFRLVIMWP